MFYLMLIVTMVFAELPGWGIPVDTCKNGLIEEQGHCCWPGQGWTGTACVGTPQCPETFSKSGSTCAPSSCPTGQTRVPDGNWGQCCWEGQAYSSFMKRCVGIPTSCPSGKSKTDEGCIKPTSVAKMLAKLKGSGYTAKLIPAGSFMMGCTSEQGDDCNDIEKPVHKVTISKDFYLMESEVTQALYERVMGYNPSYFKRPNRPVETVSWNNALKFCNTLSEMEGLDQCYTINGNDVSWSNKSCNGWRLPTEAEWEYAARGGESYKYAGSNSLDDVSWYGYYDEGGSNRTETAEGTKDVCGKKRNGYGLCDMSGNVYEWVWDWSGEYSSTHSTDPEGPNSGQYRVNRGGRWDGNAKGARVSYRSVNIPDFEYDVLGFRPGRNP